MLRRSRVLVVCAVALLLSGYGRAVAAQADDLQLFKAVQREVLEYPQFSIFDNVEAGIEDGVVTLTGRVTLPYKRDAIGRRVAEVYGVREVANRIEVLPVSHFDDELRFRIARAIYGNASLNQYAVGANPPIHIIVERGRVTLEGVVNSHVDRMQAYSIARSFGSFGVTNNLRTNAEARDELERL